MASEAVPLAKGGLGPKAARRPEACRFLAAHDELRPSRWKSNGTEYGCKSGAWKLGTGAITNDMTYSATGDATRATRLQLKLDVNDKPSAAEAQKTLATTADALAKDAKVTLPPEIRDAIEKGQSKHSGPFDVKREEAPDGKSYGVTVTIALAV